MVCFITGAGYGGVKELRLSNLQKSELLGWAGWRDVTEKGRLFVDPMVSHKDHWV